MTRFVCRYACALALIWSAAGAQTPQNTKRPPQPPPKVTVSEGDKIRTGESPKSGKQDAGEGTFGESRTQGSLAPRPTEPTPTGQPPS